MKIFISHSENDKEIVKYFVELLYNIGLKDSDMFCSSIADLGVPNDGDIFEYLRNMFETEELYVLFMLSDNYYKSVACLNEMGAAWVKQSKYMTFLLPGFDFKEIIGAINPRKIAIKLDGEKDTLKARLNAFKDELMQLFNTNISLTRWERIRDDFIERIKIDTDINMSISESYCIGETSKKGCILTAKNTRMVSVRVDFSKTKTDLCSLVIFPNVSNWSQWVNEDRKICFNISATKNVGEVELEVKPVTHDPKYRIEIGLEEKTYNIPLKSISNRESLWKNITEICFLFERDKFKDETDIFISDLYIS